MKFVQGQPEWSLNIRACNYASHQVHPKSGWCKLTMKTYMSFIILLIATFMPTLHKWITYKFMYCVPHVSVCTMLQHITLKTFAAQIHHCSYSWDSLVYIPWMMLEQQQYCKVYLMLLVKLWQYWCYYWKWMFKLMSLLLSLLTCSHCLHAALHDELLQ